MLEPTSLAREETVSFQEMKAMQTNGNLFESNSLKLECSGGR